MGIFVVFVWFGISLACIYGSVWLVTGRKSEDWNGMMLMALLIPFIESLRVWPLILVYNRAMVIGLRVAAAVVCVIMLYIYAHLRMGLEREAPKWLFATMYPGVKLILFFMFKHLPK